MPRHARTPSIECRICGCRRNEVTDSHKHEVIYLGHRRTIIKRYRKCGHCGFQFTTVETYEDEENSHLPEGITPFRPAPEGTGISGVYKPGTIPKADTQGDEPAKPPLSRRRTSTSLPPEKAKPSKRKR